MKKLSVNFLNFLSVLLSISAVSAALYSSSAHAATLAQMEIVPSSTAAISTPAVVTYTVTADAPVSNLQVIPSPRGYSIPSYITATLQSDTCTGNSLSPAGTKTCSFALSLVSSAGHTGEHFTLAPAVSGNNGAAWSIPTAANRISVTVAATPSTFTVTPSGDGNESITPNTAQTVNSGATQSFTVIANSGYTLSSSAGGTCPAGSFSGSTYTTGAITSDCTVSFSAALSTTLSANVNTALFSFNDASTTGSMGTGNSVITITNTGSAPALAVEGITLPSGVTESANTCGSSLAANATCHITFTTTTTPDSTQTISIKGTNTNTVSLPIAPLSVRVYSSPVNPVPSNASLMLVNTCTVPEQLLITNNSSSAVTSLTFDTSAFSGVTTDVTNCPVSSLPAGKSCVVGIIANSTSVNTTGGNVLMGWNGASAQGAILTGVEATGATLPAMSTPSSPTTVFGGYVYQEDTICNLVKIAALQDEYTNGTGAGPAAGSVAWTTSSYYSTAVPNPATGSGTGAQNTGLAAGQINTIAVIYQAGTPLTSYAAGLCSQYVENDSGTNYVNWYLPWTDNVDPASSSTSELAAMYANLSNGASLNGFNNIKSYWSSSEANTWFGADRYFVNGNWGAGTKDVTGEYVRCARALTY